MRDLLEQRRQTHGDFTDVASVAQATKAVWRSAAEWERLSQVQAEALEAIANKVSRILSGDPNCLDHWVDIGGYAQLVIARTK